MKFYMVVNYYLVSLSIKFHEDPCINARARVSNVRAHVSSQVRTFTTHVRASMHRSSLNFFCEGRCIDVRTQVVNARTRDKMCAGSFTTHKCVFMCQSS